MGKGGSSKLTTDFIKQNLMGPNAVLMAQELCEGLALGSDSVICDLGCGSGLTSLYLAELTGGKIYACDLWVSEEENRKRFEELGVADQITAVNCDAFELPFPEGFFDAILSVDSYHYFGRRAGAIDKVSSFVKPGGPILVAVPGMRKTLDDEMMEVLSLSWTREELEPIVTAECWRDIFEQSDSVVLSSIEEMGCFEQAWADWLSSGNEHAAVDCRAMDAGADKIMNLLAMKLVKR